MKQHKRVLFVEENCSFRCDSTLILFCTLYRFHKNTVKYVAKVDLYYWKIH